MAISKQRVPTVLLNTTQTSILPVVNTSGVDLGNISFVNFTNTQQQAFISVVPTGQTMGTGNGILWNIGLGSGGFLSISEPRFLASGDTLMGSGTPGIGIYTSYLKLN